MFRIKLGMLDVNGEITNREVKFSEFTTAIEEYLKVIDFAKGEILWGSKAIEARITFLVDSTQTEVTRIQFGRTSGELEVFTLQ